MLDMILSNDTDSMKTILLAAINARYTHSCLALYSLKSYVSGSGHDIILREYSINRDGESILADMADLRPDVIGLSVYIWNSAMVRRILPLLKQRCDNALLLLGGPEVSYDPESWLDEFPGIDCIIAGPGETAFRKLLEHGPANGEKIMHAPNPPFGEMPAPYADVDLDMLANRYVYYESSRGCPFRCSYCLSSRGDQKYEAKSADTVKRELSHILSHRPQLVKFVDRTFNMAGNRHRDIWSFLIERYGGGPTTFHFEIHPSYLDEDDLTLLARAPKGLFQIEAGVQSTNAAVRAASGRAGDWETEKAALARVIGMGTIRVHLDLIAGLPFEDLASVRNSFNEVYGLAPGRFQQGILKVLPGTEMRERSGEYGMIHAQTAPYQVRETRWLAREEMRLIEKIAVLIDRLYNEKHFPLTLAWMAARFDSPFDLFRSFASDDTPLSKGSESAISFLLGFAARRFPEYRDYFLDTLRWDWCSTARTHLYPEMIRPAEVSFAKKKGGAFFRSLAKDGTVLYCGAAFALSDLKKSIFFMPVSDRFRAEQMSGSSYALFLPDKRVVLF